VLKVNEILGKTLSKHVNNGNRFGELFGGFMPRGFSPPLQILMLEASRIAAGRQLRHQSV